MGAPIAKNFVPLTELPPPRIPKMHFHGGRRHLEDDCKDKPSGNDVVENGKIVITGDYYDDRVAKTVATVIFPDHIDRKFRFKD